MIQHRKIDFQFGYTFANEDFHHDTNSDENDWTESAENRMKAKKRKAMREKRLLKLFDAIALELYSSSDKTKLFRQNLKILAKLVQLEIGRNRRNEYFHEDFYPDTNSDENDWTESAEWAEW